MWTPADEVRVFSIEEANALVPKLIELVGEQMDVADEIQTRVTALSEHVQTTTEGSAEVVDITVYPADATTVRSLKAELAALIRRYRQGWREVQELGAIVKDTSTGLLDFYGKVDDRLVWLCWKYGETSIDYYHELDTGFAGRKPLDEIRKRMLN
jgi:hypothetical protein